MKKKFLSFIIIVSLISSLLLAGASCSKEALRSAEEESPAQGSAAGQDKEEGSSDDRSSDSGESKDYEDVDWSKYNPDEWLVGFGAEIATEMGKTAITITDGKSIWVADDEIKVYSNDGKSGKYKYVLNSQKFFPVSESDLVPAGKTYYAVYPASVCTSATSTDGRIAIDLAGAVTSGSLETGGIISGSAATMACSFTGKSATFHNIGEVLVVRMYGTENVKSLTISNAGSQLASNGTVDVSSGTPSFSPLTGKMDSVISFEDGSCPKLKANEPTDFYFIMLPGQSLTKLQFKTEFSQQVGGAGTYYHPVVTQNTDAFSSSAMNHMTRVKLHTHYFSGGDGRDGSPYLIKTVTDLQALASFVNSTAAVNDVDNNTFFRNASYALADDIDMSGQTFAGIGGTKTQENLAFSGKFNGQKSSYSISNLSHGLFNHISGAEISNVKLTGVDWTIASGNNYGALAGSMKGGAISGCDVSGSISAPNSVTVGGLLGEVVTGAPVTISGSTANCNVTAVRNVGGLVGYVNQITSSLASIINCSVGTGSGQVQLTSNLAEGGEDTSRIGGLVGGGHCNISGCVVGNDGNNTYNVVISASEREVGGLAGGYYGEGTVSESRVIRASVTSSYPADAGDGKQHVYAGGMIGQMSGSACVEGCSTGTTVLNCKVEAVRASRVGGLVGSQVGNSRIKGNSGQYMVDCNTADYYVSGYKRVGGIVGNIESGSLIGESGKIVKAKVNIIAGQAIGGIVGQANGGSTVSYCELDAFNFSAGTSPAASVNLNFGGIVGYAYGNGSEATLSHCNVNTSVIPRSNGYYNNIGGVVGYTSAQLTVSDCNVSANVTGGDYTGGIVGRGEQEDSSSSPIQVNVSNCNVSGGTIQGVNRLGGIIGSIRLGTVDNCTVSSAVADGSTSTSTQSYANIGGIVGAITGYVTVSDCTNSGNVTVNGDTQNVGGIAGAISSNLTDATKGQNLKIENCLNSGNVNAYQDVGGIIGQMGSGTISYCRVRKSANSDVTVSSRGANAGGIAGVFYSGTIDHCYSRCNVSSLYRAGGIVGDCDARDADSRYLAIIINCISRSTVSSTSYVEGGNCSTGGIVGAMFSNYDNYAIVANSVALERTIRNTNSAESICIGAIAGYMVRQNPGTKGATRLDNCYSQHNDNSLTYKDGTQCPEGGKYGGIFGHLQASQCYNCYYRTGQEGLQNSGAIAENYTKITTAQKNGTATISSVTTWNGSTSTTRTVKGKYLWEVLTQASYSGTSGETARKYNTMYSGTQVAFDTWEKFNNGQDLYFSIPKGLYDKGTDWYL